MKSVVTPHWRNG